MPASLVDELQLDASNTMVSVSILLRKALVVASRLEVAEIPEWIDKELSGYVRGDSLPSYRIVHGAIKGRILGRWIPVQFPATELRDKVSEQFLHESVAEIEDIIARAGHVTFGFSPEGQRVLQSIFHGAEDAEFACFIEKSRLVHVLDEVRNGILRWTLALSRAGVRGEGLTFSPAEKDKAHAMTFNVGSGGSIVIGVAGGTGNQANVASGGDARVNYRSRDQSQNSIGLRPEDLAQLAGELVKLRESLLPLANNAEHYAAIGAVASAETAAREKSEPGVSRALSALGAASKWVLDTAQTVGVPLAVAALKMHLGLPPG